MQKCIFIHFKLYCSLFEVCWSWKPPRYTVKNISLSKDLVATINHRRSLYSICKCAGMFASVWIHLRAVCVWLVCQSIRHFSSPFFWSALEHLHLHTHNFFHPCLATSPPPHSLHPSNNQPINIRRNLTTPSNRDQVKEAVHMHYTHIKTKHSTLTHTHTNTHKQKCTNIIQHIIPRNYL